jgi:LacI family transcriptional regulator
MIMKGNKEITIYDVARHLDLSPSTVSRGLKDHPHIRKETKKRILNAAREMGYQHNKFASSLRQRRTHTLGVIVPKLNSYFMATAIAGIEKVTNKYGFNLIISQSQESLKKEMAGILTLYNSRVDGLLVSLSFETKNLDPFDIFFRKEIPVVFFDRVFECKGCANIVIDNFRAGYEVTSHLLAQGCKRIMHLGGSLLRNVYAERLNGYRKALEESGIEYDKELVIICDLDENSGIEAARRIVGMKNRPDGLFAANDTSAVATICELQRAGIDVPRDIAVAGFNNEPISRVVQPNLTTIHYPAMEIGEMAANTLINRLTDHHNNSLKSVILDHSLIIRQSTIRKGVDPI